MPRAGADEELAGCMMDELLFHDAAGALALAADDDDAFVDSLLRLEGADPAASADDLEVALLAGEMLLDAAHPAPLALYDDDAATDVASESASPPPALADLAAGSPAPSPASPALSSAASSPCQPYSPPRVVSTAATPSARRAAPAIRPAPPQKADPTAPSHVAALPFPTNALPYALPIAYFPAAALNANQKRPFTEVFPGDSTDAQVDSKSSGGVDSGNDHSAKKSKREIRQMKNRESANKSRLKRKAQLSELSTEVAELKKKEQELQMVIAGLRAENKSLQNQNSFLQSLVTNFKHGEHSANSAPPALALQPRQYQQQPQKLIASCDHHPSIPSHTNFIALPMIDMMDLESYQEAEEEFALIEKRSVKRKRSSLKSLTTASAATLTMCASVFGITLLTNYDGDYTATSHIRHSGRVLHEAGPTSPALGAEGCSPDQPSLAGLLWDKFLSAWAVLSSSDLAYGVLLNVLSFMIIMMVYHWWQQPSSSEPTKHKTSRSHCDARGSRSAHRRHRICGHEVNGSMKQRSASWQPQTPEDHGSDSDTL